MSRTSEECFKNGVLLLVRLFLHWGNWPAMSDSGKRKAPLPNMAPNLTSISGCYGGFYVVSAVTRSVTSYSLFKQRPTRCWPQ